MKTTKRDYRYKSLEGARFLPRNNLFLPFRHHFVMVKAGQDGKGPRSDENGPQVSRRKQDPQQFFREPEGAPSGTQGRLA